MDWLGTETPPGLLLPAAVATQAEDEGEASVTDRSDKCLLEVLVLNLKRDIAAQKQHHAAEMQEVRQTLQEMREELGQLRAAVAALSRRAD